MLIMLICLTSQKLDLIFPIFPTLWNPKPIFLCILAFLWAPIIRQSLCRVICILTNSKLFEIFQERANLFIIIINLEGCFLSTDVGREQLTLLSVANRFSWCPLSFCHNTLSFNTTESSNQYHLSHMGINHILDLTKTKMSKQLCKGHAIIWNDSIAKQICSWCPAGNFVMFLDTRFCFMNFHFWTFFFPFSSFQGSKELSFPH